MTKTRTRPNAKALDRSLMKIAHAAESINELCYSVVMELDRDRANHYVEAIQALALRVGALADLHATTPIIGDATAWLMEGDCDET